MPIHGQGHVGDHCAALVVMAGQGLELQLSHGVRRLLVNDSACPGHQGTGRAQAEPAGAPELLWAMVQALEMNKGGSCQSPTQSWDGMRTGLFQDGRTCPSPASYSGCICQGQGGIPRSNRPWKWPCGGCEDTSMVCASSSQSWQCWSSQCGCGRSCCPCRAITFAELLLYLGQS